MLLTGSSLGCGRVLQSVLQPVTMKYEAPVAMVTISLAGVILIES